MTDIIIDLVTWGGYFGIFLLMVAENVFPPFPSEVIMGLGGIAVARGQMGIVPLVVAGTAGTVVGNYVWYAIGWRFGYQRLRPFVDRYGRWLTLDWEHVLQLERFFQRHGQWVVFVFRFMPAFRTMVSLPAGMARMPQGRFLLWTAAGAAIWNTGLAYAGYYLGSNFRELDAFIGPAAVALIVAIAIGYVWRLLRWKPRG
ncbi:DedA family protein [Sphingomonas psychrolutea]|uniref:Alkaline phosphatase n=1 Tax=Sphingomonas psychrolutea TaxID=1259676 RepID=A0ABQ1H3V1_9SPHN|nr:DedA family protein [Sphingomonas psychrolutea]GGA57836.1 alkaline phosphatase [Sphingomonas psychrolutea]